uniref:Uncharacterized protein n=1 Tax=Caenorhabditis japonica TaxID=281687 RepID=A0A8R1IMS1_CAEJA
MSSNFSTASSSAHVRHHDEVNTPSAPPSKRLNMMEEE